ncbi:MAG TPA: class I SAM-dependent methyltransferase [Candidatus Dormibacteraeota bacterium]|nr:class I SAM-dependent methyltransferase [Candidatus Dormibacteraeota bacterium]
MRRSALRLYVFALGLGVRMILRGMFVEGIRLLISPVGYWRFLPNAFTYQEFLRFDNPRTLDVSSPKLPSVFFATLTSREVRATDLDDDKIFSRWKPAADALGLSNYFVEYQDARHLTYPDETFDFIYSISVIEHIPDDGDAVSLREFRRVLKPGGTLVVQIPYRRKRDDIWLSVDSKGMPLPAPRFYERHYDMERLNERLATEGLRLTQRVIMGEWLNLDPMLSATSRLPRYLRIAIRPLEPLLALVNFWARTDDASGYPLGALLVYRRV